MCRGFYNPRERSQRKAGICIAGGIGAGSAISIGPGGRPSGAGQWLQFRRRCGFPDVRLHDLRRTKGAYAAISGVSLQKIGGMLGHKSLGSTQIYARLSEESVQDASRAADAAMQQAAMNSSKKPRKAVPMLAAHA